MANVGKNRLVKVIFTKIHKISDACANGFGRYIMIAMNKFLWKDGVSENFKAHLPQHPTALQKLFSPNLFNFIQKSC